MAKRGYVILLSSVALVSCGGGSSTGGGGGGTGVVVPNPTPAPNPPTPPPPPPPVYATFASLTGDQTYASACTGYGIGLGGFPVITGSTFYSREGTLSYAAATQSYRFFQPNSGGPGELFGPGDRDANPPAGTISFTRPGEGGGTSRLVIATPSASGTYDYGRAALIDINRGGVGEIGRASWRARV